jgi:hypothetical protein
VVGRRTAGTGSPYAAYAGESLGSVTRAGFRDLTVTPVTTTVGRGESTA